MTRRTLYDYLDPSVAYVDRMCSSCPHRTRNADRVYGDLVPEEGESDTFTGAESNTRFLTRDHECHSSIDENGCVIEFSEMCIGAAYARWKSGAGVVGYTLESDVDDVQRNGDL